MYIGERMYIALRAMSVGRLRRPRVEPLSRFLEPNHPEKRKAAISGDMRPFFFLDGRGERIRTSDPHNPIVVRYQTALRPDRREAIIRPPAQPEKKEFVSDAGS